MSRVALALTVLLALGAILASVLLAPRGPEPQVVVLEPAERPVETVPLPLTPERPAPSAAPAPQPEPQPAEPEPAPLPAAPLQPEAAESAPVPESPPEPEEEETEEAAEPDPEPDSSTEDREAATVSPGEAGSSEGPVEPTAAAEATTSAQATAATGADGPTALPLRRGSGGVGVQVASFRTRDFADRLRERLAAAGFPASVESGGEFYRVVAGPFADEAAARAAAERIAPLAR